MNSWQTFPICSRRFVNMVEALLQSTVQHEFLVEENFGKLGESLVVCQIVLSKFKQCLMTNKDSKLPQNFTHQKFMMGNLPKFSSAKHLHYTVL